MNTSVLKQDDLLDPCVQVATYESQKLNGHDNFYEIQHFLLPTCGFIWQGVDGALLDLNTVSSWSLIPTE